MSEYITPDELMAELAGPNPPLVIDVREKEAYQAAHIPGATSIPIDELPEALPRLSKDRPLVTY